MLQRFLCLWRPLLNCVHISLINQIFCSDQSWPSWWFTLTGVNDLYLSVMWTNGSPKQHQGSRLTDCSSNSLDDTCKTWFSEPSCQESYEHAAGRFVQYWRLQRHLPMNTKVQTESCSALAYEEKHHRSIVQSWSIREGFSTLHTLKNQDSSKGSYNDTIEETLLVP